MRLLTLLVACLILSPLGFAFADDSTDTSRPEYLTQANNFQSVDDVLFQIQAEINQLYSAGQQRQREIDALKNRVPSGGGSSGGSSSIGTWSCSANGGKSGLCSPKGSTYSGYNSYCTCN